jgi:hypothetical protein
MRRFVMQKVAGLHNHASRLTNSEQQIPAPDVKKNLHFL